MAVLMPAGLLFTALAYLLVVAKPRRATALALVQLALTLGSSLTSCARSAAPAPDLGVHGGRRGLTRVRPARTIDRARTCLRSMIELLQPAPGAFRTSVGRSTLVEGTNRYSGGHFV